MCRKPASVRTTSGEQHDVGEQCPFCRGAAGASGRLGVGPEVGRIVVLHVAGEDRQGTQRPFRGENFGDRGGVHEPPF